MTVDLNRILCRVAVRSAHHHRKHLIECFLPVIHHSIMNRVRLCIRQTKALSSALKNPIRNLNRLRSADPDDSDSRTAHRRSNRCDRIGNILHIFLFLLFQSIK